MMLNVFLKFQQKIFILRIVFCSTEFLTGEFFDGFDIAPIGNKGEVCFCILHLPEKSKSLEACSFFIIGNSYTPEKLRVRLELFQARNAVPDSCNHTTKFRS